MNYLKALVCILLLFAASVLCAAPNSVSYYQTEWCGLERIIKKSVNPFERLKTIEKVVANDKTTDSELFDALISMRYIYTYEIRDSSDAEMALMWLKQLGKSYSRAEFEVLLSSLKPEDMLTEEGNRLIGKLLSYDSFFPYDNGYLPVVEKAHLTFMLAVSDMALGKSSNLTLCKDYSGFSGLPVTMIYDMACDRKLRAYARFINSVKKSQNHRVSKMLEDVLSPMYLPLKQVEKKFLAGLACAQMFPHVSTRLFLDCITGEPRIKNVEHGLAVLALHYRSNNAFQESDIIFEKLSKLYPKSVWLK